MLYNRLCIPVPYAGGRVFEIGDEKIFKYHDTGNWWFKSRGLILQIHCGNSSYHRCLRLLVASVMVRDRSKSITIVERKKFKEVARQEFDEIHGEAFRNLTKEISSPVPNVLVAGMPRSAFGLGCPLIRCYAQWSQADWYSGTTGETHDGKGPVQEKQKR